MPFGLISSIVSALLVNKFDSQAFWLKGLIVSACWVYRFDSGIVWQLVNYTCSQSMTSLGLSV